MIIMTNTTNYFNILITYQPSLFLTCGRLCFCLSSVKAKINYIRLNYPNVLKKFDSNYMLMTAVLTLLLPVRYKQVFVFVLTLYFVT